MRRQQGRVGRRPKLKAKTPCKPTGQNRSDEEMISVYGFGQAVNGSILDFGYSSPSRLPPRTKNMSESRTDPFDDPFDVYVYGAHGATITVSELAVSEFFSAATVGFAFHFCRLASLLDASISS